VSIKGFYDVVVVGGGPAGAAFVRQLGNRGVKLSVLLIDKQTFPRDKVCGDAVSVHSLAVLHRIFPESHGLFPTRNLNNVVTLWFPNGTSVPLRESSVDVVPRFEFDEFLWSSATRSNVEVLEGARVTDFVSSSSAESSVTVLSALGVREITATLVLGADGSNSVIRQTTGPVDSDLQIVPVRQYVKGVPEHEDGLVIIMDPANKGYFWIFPFEREGCRWANVGYGSQRTNPRRRFEELCRTPLAQKYLGSGTFEGKLKGSPLNLVATRWNRFVPHRPVAGRGYMLLGDAACLGHPHTGEGISAALFSGALAADLLADGLRGDCLAQAYEAQVFDYLQSTYGMVSSSILFACPCLLPSSLSSLYVKLLGWQYRRHSGRSAHRTRSL